MNELSDLLACPRSGAGLSFQENRFVASGGAAAYPVEDGIIDLRCNRRDYYFNPVPRRAMDELTRQAAHVPWSQTIRRFLQHVKHNRDWLDNLVADGRYAWKLLLDLQPGSQVLDLGCGLGNLTKNLAPHVGRVFAMDLTIERLRFARERFARFNRDDDIVLLAGGDGAHLPFRDQSLDLVVLSGVLEWVADDGNYSAPGDGKLARALKMSLTFFGARNPRAVQRRFLQEIRRVLKPSGQLFIAIENRLNLEYFYRRVDHHSSLRFASLLPRFAANLYSIAASRRPYRTYTHSLSGYRRLLASAGFDAHQFFGLTPGYSNLREIRPLVTSEPIWSPAEPEGLWQRIVRDKRLVPAFGIIAGASAAPRPSLLGRLLSHLDAQLGLNAPLAARGFRLSDDDQGVLELEAAGRKYLLHTPSSAPAVERMKAQQETLASLRRRSALRRVLPTMHAHGAYQGIHYFLESRPAGRPLAELLANGRREAYLEQVVSLLRGLRDNGSTAGTLPLTGELYRAEVDEPLRRIAQALDSQELVTPLAGFLRRALYGMQAGYGFVHGHFRASNILVGEEKALAVVDWRYSRKAGLPVLDFLDYLDSIQPFHAPAASEVDKLERLAKGAWPDRMEWDAFQRHYGSFASDPHLLRAAVYLGWVHRTARQLDTYLVYEPLAIDSRIVRVLEHASLFGGNEHGSEESLQCAHATSVTS